ncbi:MAG: hypothetical protein E7L17_07420 [Clostridium sp.]|uniref:hypothetical protein n=1 Tax=Clostridium sp. TaxID=1506 RepID=UPI002906D0E4|nr:hypothetical protein [Clostridium sp.]MDU7337926.1 hypothetical protein [Clostridium sp.]
MQTKSLESKLRNQAAKQGLSVKKSRLDKIDTRKELSTLAKVGERTYSKIVDVMESDNEKVKKKLMGAEISVDATYKEAVYQVVS